MARDLMDEAQKQRPYWESSLKAIEPDSAGGGEGSTVYLVEPPEMMDDPHLVRCARHIARVIAEDRSGPFDLPGKLRAALESVMEIEEQGK